MEYYSKEDVDYRERYNEDPYYKKLLDDGRAERIKNAELYRENYKKSLLANGKIDKKLISKKIIGKEMHEEELEIMFGEPKENHEQLFGRHWKANYDGISLVLQDKGNGWYEVEKVI